MSNRSFIRWAGSKKKLIPVLTKYWNSVSASRYIEPFAGSAALFFAIKPTACLLSDMNEELINMYICVQKNYRRVYNILKEMELGADAYYVIREQRPLSMCKYKRAARFVYLNRFCFNGLYRTNAQGLFNVPYAKGTKANLPSKEEICTFSKSLQNASFICQDFRRTIELVKKGDFVYIDPPYAIENHRIFRQYGATTFGQKDLEDLSALLIEINSKKAFFVLSYAYFPQVVELFSNWNQTEAFVQRTVSGQVTSRKLTKEILISNFSYSQEKK
jgi:DNA adenine methylase